MPGVRSVHIVPTPNRAIGCRGADRQPSSSIGLIVGKLDLFPRNLSGGVSIRPPLSLTTGLVCVGSSKLILEEVRIRSLGDPGVFSSPTWVDGPAAGGGPSLFRPLRYDSGEPQA